MKTFWKKTGWAALTVLPAIISLAAQLLLGGVIVLVLAVLGSSGLAAQIQLFLIEHTSDFTAAAIFLYHIISLLGFGLWYYLGCGKPKPVPLAAVFKKKCLPITVFMGLFMCLGADALLSAAEYLLPDLLQSYSDLMEAAGLGINVFVIAASILIAPIGEEILCRGLIFHYAGRLVEGMKNPKAAFWTANVLQALLFGIMHANLVQGTYAFLMGLCLGWLRYRYRSLYPSILAHFVVNFSSSFMTPLLSLIPESFILYVLVGIICIAAIVALMRWERKDDTASAS